MKLALIGIALGLFAAYWLTRFLQKMLFGIGVTDPMTFSIIALMVVFVAILACIVPARRAMTWQMTTPDGQPVVRERYWVTFQPGEIRTCANCHGVNRGDQLGRPAATNPPLALREFLRHWKSNNVPTIGFETIANSDYTTITFKRQTAATNLTQRVDVSTDLLNWSAASAYSSTGATQTGLLEEIGNVPGSFQTITLRETASQTGQPKRFYRLISQ